MFLRQFLYYVSPQWPTGLYGHWSSQLPFNPSRIGSWWHKGDEIDILALNDKNKEVLFCEVKWSDLTPEEAETLLERLKQKSNQIDWNRGRRREYHVLMCRELKGKAPIEGTILSLRDVATLLGTSQ